MLKSRFRVVSDPAPWSFWRGTYLLVRVSSAFDDLNHPYGQWTVRLEKSLEPPEAEPWKWSLEFLVDEAPWRLIQPGMRLACFYGTRRLPDLLVQPEGSPV